MSKSVGGNKRKLEPTEVEKYLNTNHAHIIGKVRNYVEETNTSVHQETGAAHILYFEAFLHHPMKLVSSDPCVTVLPKEWATAFIQRDLQTTTIELCKFILTLKNKSRPKKELLELIQKTALWMMSKFEQNVDPWSFPSDAIELLPNPCLEDKVIIHETIIQYLLDNPLEDAERRNEQTSVDALIMDDLDNLFENTVLDEVKKYEIIYEEFAKIVEASGCKFQPAHMTCALTRSTIITNTDIFVDAVQIANNRWTQAASPPIVNEIAEIATKIAKTNLIRLDFANERTVTCVGDFCPVKRLAIYRGTKFIYETYNGHINARAFDFNSEILEHNVFPTSAECDKIDEALVKLGIQMCNSRALGADCANSSQQLDECAEFSDNMAELIKDGCGLRDNSHESQFSELLAMLHSELESETEARDDNAHENAAQDSIQHEMVTDEITIHVGGKSYSYPREKWKTILKGIDDKDGLVKAGKELLPIVFKEEELENCTPSGRSGSLVQSSNCQGRLDRHKQQQILDTLEYLVRNHSNTKTWNDDLKEILKQHVLIEGTYQLRRKLKELRRDQGR